MNSERSIIPDRIIAEPGGSANGEFTVPGDKSISHRSVMFSALADGRSSITGCLLGEDVIATMNAFRAMGVTISQSSEQIHIDGVGVDGLTDPEKELDLGNSGTSMRLIAGILSGAQVNATLTGDASLSRRPMKRVTDPLAKMGAQITTRVDGRPPLTVRAHTQLSAIDYELPVASAQVKSAVLLAGLFAKGETSVIESAVTRDHTERMLAAYGVAVAVKPIGAAKTRISINGGQRLNATDVQVPGDISSAAFFLVAAVLKPDQHIRINNVGINPTRTGIIEILRLMGADIELANERNIGNEPVADISITSRDLKGVDIPQYLVPLAIDEFPAIFIAAACAEGVTSLRGASELRVKESDRIEVMANGLKMLGVEVKTYSDGIDIHGCPSFGGGAIHSDGDHRIAMSFAIASLRARASIEISGCEAIATSFPEFVELATRAGIELRAEP